MENPGSFQMFFMWMGPFKWVMIILSLLVLYLILRKVYDLFLRSGIPADKLKHGLNAILFWGIFAFVMGLFAQIYGLWIALQDIIKADDISNSIMTIGFLGTFASTLFGTSILLIAGFCWWALRSQAFQMISRSRIPDQE